MKVGTMRLALTVAAALAALQPLAVRAQALTDSAKGVLGAWEFSDADRERKCTLTLLDERAGANLKLQFAPQCAEPFPFSSDIASWSYPDNDMLRLFDGSGRAVVEFSEVESGIFEAPTLGQGVLFLQKPGSADVAPKPPERLAGDWAIVRGGKALCSLTLSTNAADDGYALTVKPDCDATLARLNFSRWKIDRDELMLSGPRGNPWRFEEEDDRTWSRVPETANPYTLERQ